MKDLSMLAGLLCIPVFLFLVPVRNQRYRIPLCAAAVAVITVFGILHPQEYTTQQYELLDLISFALYIGGAFFLLKKPPVVRTFTFALLYVATADMIWSFTESLLPFASESYEAMATECGFNILFGLLVTAVFMLIYKKGQAGALACAASDFPLWVPVCLFIFELACYYREFGISTEIYNILFAVSACLIVACILYLYFRMQNLFKKQEEVYTRLSEQIEFSEKIQKSDDELRAFRHDIKNHFIVLNSYFKAGEYDKASEYVDMLAENSQAFLKRYSTGNRVADSLLTVKAEQTPIDFEGIIPDDMISPDDICIILGNLLDNAVRACKNIVSAEKNIQIRSWVKNGNLVMKISNPFDGGKKEKTVYRKLETTKQDKKNHGYGLANVNKAVEKYNGSVNLYSKDGKFTAEIILKGDKKK